MPTIDIRPGEVQRWRIVNASAARVYRLALPGHKLIQIGSDGGLFEMPVVLDEILLANGERVELLVRGVGKPLFPRRALSPSLQLTTVHKLNAGMVELRYDVSYQ
jgi:FtsP/CotA-like multicopper oxidase with cupredoxin domain